MTYIHFNHFPIRPGRQEVTLSPEKKKIMGKNNTLEHPISTRPRLHTYSSKKQGVVNQAAIRHSTEPSIRVASGRRFASSLTLVSGQIPIKSNTARRHHSKLMHLDHQIHIK